MALVFATINICGLNDVSKQIQVKMLSMQYKLDVLFLQEHNIRDRSRIRYLEDYFEIIINELDCFKGGTCFLINKNSNIEVLSTEKDDEGHVLYVRVRYLGEELTLINIYAPSGNNKKAEREDLFYNGIVYYLRNNISNVIMAGDFNCVVSARDVSTGRETSVSKALSSLVKQLSFKDAWFATNHMPVYTFFRKSYASRIDRVYVTNLYKNIISCENVPLSLSDHNMVITKITINSKVKIGKGYWKLNSTLLDRDDFIENFKELWSYLKSQIRVFDNILIWWDEFAKDKIKVFFLKLSRQAAQEKYSTLNFLQSILKSLTYKNLCDDVIIDRIKEIKDRIKLIKEDVCEGIKIRMKVDDRLKGERVSLHLLGKEKVKARKQTMEVLNTEGGVLDNTEAIIHYIKSYYEVLFSEVNVESNLQDYFLQYVEKGIGDTENEMLTEVTEREIWDTFKSMNRGKAPGEDGLVLEFYLKVWPIIRNEFVQVVKYVLVENRLGQRQTKGIIKLAPKSSDLGELKNWRPISLLDIDYKCIAKILANRMKTLI